MADASLGTYAMAINVLNESSMKRPSNILKTGDAPAVAENPLERCRCHELYIGMIATHWPSFSKEMEVYSNTINAFYQSKHRVLRLLFP